MRLYSLTLALALSAIAVPGMAQRIAPNSTPTPAPASVPAAPKPVEATVEVPLDAAVITLDGTCKSKDAKSGECKTIITRAQFERLVDALVASRPGRPAAISPADKRRLATQYANALYFATEAEKLGLQNEPQVQERLRVTRLRSLEQEFTRDLQEKSQPSQAEIQKYYSANLPHFTDLNLSRIQIPLRTKDGSKPDEGALKKLADDLRQRAAGGADFTALQAEAYEKAGLTNPPDTKAVFKEDRVPPKTQAVLLLKPGDVSEVVQEPTGFTIFRLESRKAIPLEEVKQEIQNTLANTKFRQAMEELGRKAMPDLSTQYFGPAPSPVSPTAAPRLPGRPTLPPTESSPALRPAAPPAQPGVPPAAPIPTK